MLDIHFAPLQGYTENVYRRAHFECAGGVAAYYTPFLRLEKGAVRKKDSADLVDASYAQICGREMRLIPQVIVANENEFKVLVEYVIARGYREIDLNMGCPFPMQVKSGRGSGLLPRANVVERILDEMQRFLSANTGLKFSVKMRLGLESAAECLELLPLLDKVPLQHVALHPRLGVQQYKGAVDMEGFSRFYENSANKVIYNGDVTEAAQIHEIEKMFPDLGGVMIGRGLLARPSLAVEYAGGREWDASERLALTMKMHESIFEKAVETYQGDSQILSHLHPFWEYQQELLPKKIFKSLMKAGTVKEYFTIITQMGSKCVRCPH